MAPQAMLAPTAPAVGIFWRVGDHLVIDRSPVAMGETYGDCITHAGGHYERWQQWQAIGATRLVGLGYPLAIVSTEYDEWPRGRIVYETPTRRFMLYADRRLQKPDIIVALKGAFGLTESTVLVKSDAHYR